MKSGSKVKAWFEKLIKDLRAILDKAYNILKSQKSWEQMELIRNNKQTLDMIADYYFEGMEGTKGKAANGDGGARYSIQTTENGKQYDEADRKVISGDNPSEWARQVEDYINNEIRHGRDVTVYSANGVPLTITADTASKATFRNFVTLPDGSKRPMTDSEYSVKLRAESHIDELAQVSRGTGTRKVDKKNHSFARDGFDYRKAYFKDHTGYYELLISVGKQGRINTVYNVGRIKEADFPTMGLKGPTRSKTETRNTASIDNMPQSSEKVKLSAKDSGADIREVNPMEITPPNRVTSSNKYHFIQIFGYQRMLGSRRGLPPIKEVKYRPCRRGVYTVKQLTVKAFACFKAFLSAFRFTLAVYTQHICGIIPKKIRRNAGGTFHSRGQYFLHRHGLRLFAGNNLLELRDKAKQRAILVNLQQIAYLHCVPAFARYFALLRQIFI